MRILLVIDGMHPRDGGPPAVIAGSAIALKTRGLDVTVLTTLIPGDEADVERTWAPMIKAGVKLRYCAPVGLKHLVGLRAVDRTIADAIQAADVVHVHGFWTPALITAARMARRTGTPYFISTHGLLDRRAMTSSKAKWVKKQLALAIFGFRPVFRDANGIIFGSETEDNESWDPVRGMRKIYIPNGVEASVGQTPTPPASRERLSVIAPQFDGWRRSLLFYSRIHPEKGLDMLVKAFNAVACDFPDVGLLIAGIMKDEHYGAMVARLIEECPMPDQIVITTSLTGPESHFVYSLCDIFVLPSHAEGFSVALTEALAHGKPSLITRYCHLPLVESEGAGFVVNPDPADIETGLRKLLSRTDDELRTMGENARSLFERHFTWDRVAEQLEEAYASGTRKRDVEMHGRQ